MLIVATRLTRRRLTDTTSERAITNHLFATFPSCERYGPDTAYPWQDWVP
jgi:hypothetical protein